MMKFRQLLSCGLLLLAFASCQNRSKDARPVDREDISGFDQIDEVKEIYYRFPSPDEMLSIIDKEKLSYDEQLPLGTERASRFLDSRSQALNLGVYIADLAYITLMQRQKEILLYFQVVYGLSDKLRISSAYNPELMKRFEKNTGNFDSLKVLSDKAVIDITQYLEANNKEKVFVLISVGGFIESLYLAFQVVGNYSEGNVIIQRICDQKIVLENLMNYALEFADDKNVAAAIELIHPVRAIYNELVASMTETSVVENKEGKLIVKGGDKISITEDQYNKLREATMKTRKSITGNL